MVKPYNIYYDSIDKVHFMIKDRYWLNRVFITVLTPTHQFYGKSMITIRPDILAMENYTLVGRNSIIK